MSYYYLNSDNQPVGPMDLAAIRKLAEAGIVQSDVLVCEAGSEEWTPLSQREQPAVPPSSPKPPRTPPPQRTYRQEPPMAGASGTVRAGTSVEYPDWFPLASMVAGIVAFVTLCVPPLSLLVGAAAFTLGILGYRLPDPKARPFSIAGISTSSVALVVSLGILLFGGAGFIGNPESKYVGSWQNDMSIQIVNVQLDCSVVVTFHEDGRFSEMIGQQLNGANYDTGAAVMFDGGGETTGYWKWDPSRKAVVTRHDGRNQTAYFDGATNDGRSVSVGPFDTGTSSMKAQEEFWVFKPDPDDRNFLIGVHPTMYHNRTMRFHRID